MRGGGTVRPRPKYRDGWGTLLVVLGAPEVGEVTYRRWGQKRTRRASRRCINKKAARSPLSFPMMKLGR